jgi:hypothetical protein
MKSNTAKQIVALNSRAKAAQQIESLNTRAIEEINSFSRHRLVTRGGRVGSGMGGLLEALWGYSMNAMLAQAKARVELAWIPGHEYNDFVCLERDCVWDQSTRSGEVLRIEAKSMVLAADEAKGHFTELVDQLGEWDLLLVLVWDWADVDSFRKCPVVDGAFIGNAREVAKLRDALHLARGGTFVDPNQCPDECEPGQCTHGGEPLNSSGRPERKTGPVSTRAGKISHAANFGGLVRMLKTSNDTAKKRFQEIRKTNDVAHEFISFVHRHLPAEELSRYSIQEWQQIARQLKISTEGSKDDIADRIRNHFPDYQTLLRRL